jgi:hypothetical protein
MILWDEFSARTGPVDVPAGASAGCRRADVAGNEPTSQPWSKRSGGGGRPGEEEGRRGDDSGFPQIGL